MISVPALALALLAAVQVVESASAGCGKAPPSSGTKSMTVNGKQRQYILQLPNNYDANKAHRVVIGYHWRDGSMNDVANGGFYDLRSRAGDSTIFVAPNGLNAGWANVGGEDITFTDQIVDMLKNDLCVDETQFFATGWSYGGAMSHSVACSRPDVFKAVAVIAGAQLSGCAGGTTPVAYLGIHGAADNVLPIDLGRQLRDKWLQTNGCNYQGAQDPAPGQQAHIKTTYSCSRAPVTWIGHGGGHVPDPTGNNGVKFAPQETWDFFDAAVGAAGAQSPMT
ncbi:carbohydrate esterase family 1 protein [Thermothelomyces thermophilus ATCC 42464]|uniref:Feruloyl esterase C n=2 Tax=leotiomyceta TaxID=716546 RepID=G2QMB4_THET4|nr:carbohydrate esterase family 1 protein [Thermothelomyces thermophilus ATCC 42464]AEO61094.1 carbohydrate esterase family 1 protein [Thermothelomyces thermophilus ATCC 42464]AEP33616.1 feruloyl esterase A1 [Chrysosporium lucknowense]